MRRRHGHANARRHRVGRVASAVLGALVFAALMAGGSAAGGSAGFRIDIGSCQVAGFAPNGTSVAVTWRGRDRRLKTTQTVTADSFGIWQTRCEPEEHVEAGDRVRQTIGSHTRVVTVPTLTVVIDRVSDVVSGRGPGGRTLSVYAADVRKDVTVAPDGTWFADYAGDFDILGGESVALQYVNHAHDLIRRFATAPFIRVWRGGSELLGWTEPGKAVSIGLADGAATPRGTGNAVGALGTGAFSGSFTHAHGQPVRPRAGDLIDARDVAADSYFTVPKVAIAADPATDVVSGRCLPHGLYLVDVHRRDFTAEWTTGGRADGKGRFSQDLTPYFDIKAGTKVELVCTLPSGDQVARRITVERPRP
jgi:hypothetical protein